MKRPWSFEDLDAATFASDTLLARLEALDLPAHIHELERAGFVAVAATDLDFTVWEGDVGETLFGRAVERGWLRPEAAPAMVELLQRYGLSSAGEANRDAEALIEAFDAGLLVERGLERGETTREVTQRFYEANAWCAAGHDLPTLHGWARELFENDGFAGRVYDGVRELFEALEQLGLVPWAVSASPQWLVDVAAGYVGIPAERARGIRPRFENGRVAPGVVPPATYGPGKVAAMREATGGAPIVALGDSVDGTDRELLEAAWIPVVAEPRREKLGYVAQRVEHGWSVLRFGSTVGGAPVRR